MSARGPSREALALLDAAACGLMQTNDDGGILRVNQRFCDWTGYSAETLIGRRRLQDLLTMGGRIFHQTHWAPLLRMQGSVSEVKLEIVHADGTRLPMVLNAIRHEDQGTVVHEIAAFIARDRDLYERELVLSRQKLETLVAEANQLHAEAKDRALFAEQMMGIVSHDLKNPLFTILMGIELLTESQTSPAEQRVLARLRRSTQRANQLIVDLLDFTQARIGKGIAVVVDDCDFHGAIAEAVDELGVVHSGRKLEHVRIGQGPCRADPNRLIQLVGNLVSNAMAYGSPSSPVTVTSTIAAGVCSVAVHNDGPPIPEEARAPLFQPMMRGTTSTSGGRSVGLGLFIVREIAKAHGGTTVVESSAERGTTFRATFPRT